MRVAPRSIMLATMILVVLMCFASAAQAQLTVSDTDTGGVTGQDLVDSLLGADSAAIVSNISETGDARCLGTFAGGLGLGLGALGIDSGVILSSGRVLDAVGPNVADDTTTDFLTPGDPFLDSLAPGGETFDACLLEFDFECPATDVVSFRYVFASEEYNEYVNSEFNNIFGFELNGSNIGIIPGSGGVPVAINNLNCDNPYNPGSPTTPNVPFCDLFINNDLDDGGGAVNIEGDGLSVVLGAQGNLNPGPNHIKLAVGDVSDSILDTWVFIEKGSFQCEPLPSPCENLEPKSQGFWRRVCKKEHPDQPDRTIIDDNPGLCEDMNPDPNNDPCEKARSQCAATQFSVLSDRLDAECSVDATGETVAAAIAAAQTLIAEGTNQSCKAAQALCAGINEGEVSAEP